MIWQDKLVLTWLCKSVLCYMTGPETTIRLCVGASPALGKITQIQDFCGCIRIGFHYWPNSADGFYSDTGVEMESCLQTIHALSVCLGPLDLNLRAAGILGKFAMSIFLVY